MLRLNLIIILLFLYTNSQAQTPENWTSKQLVEPVDLAALLKSQKDVPLLINVGPGAAIPTSINIGTVNNKEGVDKLKTQLNSVDRQTNVVVYCGCCPFDHCPNVRPAIDVLKQMKFTNYHLLNLPRNIKTDWIDKGYPTIAP